MLASKPFRAIVIKEIKDDFNSSFIYIINFFLHILLGGLFFNYINLNQNYSTGNILNNILIPIWGNINFIFIFLSPILTMKTIAGENKDETLDLLLMSNLSYKEFN